MATLARRDDGLSALAGGFLPDLTLSRVRLQLQLLRQFYRADDDVLKSPAEQDKSRVRTAERLSGAIS